MSSNINYTPAPYGHGMFPDQTPSPQTGAAAPGVDPDDLQAPPVPHDLEELDQDQCPHFGAPPQPSLDFADTTSAGAPGQPPASFIVSDPMVDQALGNFFPHHALPPVNNVPLSDPASIATGHRPASDGEDFAMPYPGEAHRGPEDVQYISDVPTPIPSVAGSGSQFSGGMDETAVVQNIQDVQTVAPEVPAVGLDAPDSSSQLPSMLSSNTAGKQRASGRVESSPRPERSRRARGRGKNDLKPALVGHAAPEGWKKQDGLRDPAPALKPSGLYYDSIVDAQSRMSPPDWTPPANDVVPTTDAELVPYVICLVTAMKDMSKFKDNITSSLRKRWLDASWTGNKKDGAVLLNDFYMPHVLEALAWKLATTVRELHRNGPGIVGCLDPLVLENSFVDKDLTFEERITIFVDVCRLRKTRVSNMLNEGELERYVLTPSSILPGSEVNSKANARRAEFISDGRDAYNAKNPDKASKKRRGASSHGNKLGGGGQSTEGQDESKDEEQSVDDDTELPIDREDKNWTMDVIGNIQEAEHDDQDRGSDDDNGYLDDFTDLDELLSPAGEPSRTGDDSEDSDPVIPTFQPRQPRAGGHAKTSKDIIPATAPPEEDKVSEVVKGKCKVSQGDDIDMDRPRRKSARQSAALRDLESASQPPEKKRKRRNRDEDDDEEDEEFTAPYVGKGKGKATAKRGCQESRDRLG